MFKSAKKAAFGSKPRDKQSSVDDLNSAPVEEEEDSQEEEQTGWGDIKKVTEGKQLWSEFESSNDKWKIIPKIAEVAIGLLSSRTSFNTVCET